MIIDDQLINFLLNYIYMYTRGGGGTPHMKGVGMLIGNFELNPKRRLNWKRPKLLLTPKRDHVKTQTNEKTWII